jgi:hypothetical protein
MKKILIYLFVLSFIILFFIACDNEPKKQYIGLEFSEKEPYRIIILPKGRTFVNIYSGHEGIYTLAKNNEKNTYELYSDSGRIVCEIYEYETWRKN